MITRFCVENGLQIPIPVSEFENRNRNRDVGSLAVAAEPATTLAVDFLVDRLVFGTKVAKNKAVYEIRLLAKTSGFNRRCLVEAGAVPSLLDLLGFRTPEVQENAIAALLNLSKDSETKRVIVENGGLESIVDVVQNGMTTEARRHAAGVLFYLASVAEYRAMIGRIPRSIPALTELIVEGTDRCKKNALVAVLGLLMCSENHWKVLAAGTVPILVNLLRNPCPREEIVTDSLAILATLAERPDGSMAVLSCGALGVILDIFGSTTLMASRESCVAVLLATCVNSGADVVRVLVANPSLMGPLYSVHAEGGSRASRNASSLIKILLEFNEKSSSTATRRPVLYQERSINVW